LIFTCSDSPIFKGDDGNGEDSGEDGDDDDDENVRDIR
jgi:hypothetical protein